VYRFGDFELDLDAHLLRRGSDRLRLERRPFELLVMLVQNQGRLVSRDEIVAALWPGNVIIDFDSGLNTLVRKIRNALADSADQPLYIETVPGNGYRFIAEVTKPAAVEATTLEPATSSRRWRPTRFAVWLTAAAFVVVGAAVAWRSIVAPPQPVRIAILPFENLTGDQRLGYLGSGIAEETNTSLAAIDLPNISVIGITSTAAMARSETSLQTIGRELGVDYVVLSSLRLEQPRIRLTSRLIRTADGEQVWSASFDRELTNLLGLQRELSIAIAEQVRQRLSPAVAALIDRRQTQNPEAYELYLRGRYEWTRFLPDSIPRALEFYDQAVEKDPEYGLAWAGVAHALVTSVVTIEARRADVLPVARDALERALEFGPDLAETQLALGSFRYFMERDLDSAEAAARRAVELDPNSAMSYMFLGLMLSESGRHVEARSMLRRARELDPLFPLIFANSAYVSLAAGEPQEALELATQAVAINPEFWVGYLHRGNAQTTLGDYFGALESFTDAERLSGYNSASATSSRAYVLARLGREEEARDVLSELLSQLDERNISRHGIAVIYAALGEIDLAFEWLQQSIALSRTSCRRIETDERLDALRSDLRLEQLIDRCGRSDATGNTEYDPY
jgi:TolB-like protein/DNA-binding winged helix-turn-helix (wHTH) protein/cytochrome c-type biogenesis protein CcmH/NrfG